MKLLIRILLTSGLAIITANAKEVPYLGGRVNDYANMLSPEAIQSLEYMLKSHEDSTSNQVVVLTVQSLEGEVLEEYSIKVVEAWKLGTAKNDNGVLVLVAKDDRKVRIEVGNGLEGALTDASSGWIIRNLIVPNFKQGEYDAGLIAGVAAILKTITGEYHIDQNAEVDTPDETPPFFVALLGTGIFLVTVGTFTLASIFTKGAQSIFMFIFLMPFWGAFPVAFYGVTAGLTIFAAYIITFIVSKIYLSKTHRGKEFFTKYSKKFASSSSGSSSSGWSSSSSSSSYSGGGGSFSGGGSSGSW